MILPSMTLAASALLFLVSCLGPVHRPIFWSGPTMGTTYAIKFISHPDAPPRPSQKDVEQLLQKMNNIFSTYIPTSEISRINQNPTRPHEVSEDFHRVLSLALEVAKKTDGAFDPTVGPLVNLWGFGPGGEKKVPQAQQVQQAQSQVGYQRVALEGRKLTLSSGMALDLSALAKGYAVDQLAQLLSQRGVEDFMVEIGGEVRTSGTKDGSPWKVAIESPQRAERKIHQVLELSGDVALATSGNYRNFFEQNGHSYAHTIKQGAPSPQLEASVTVLDSQCARADAWATALMAMDWARARPLAQAHGIRALFLTPRSSQETTFWNNPGPQGP